MKRETLVLWPIVILSAMLAVAMLTKNHEWGDDFAAYIMQTVGILQGTPREAVAHTAFTMQHSSRAYGPTSAPWGFPLLLAPFYLACGGLNIFCLKFSNVLFFALFLVALFPFLTRRLSLLDSALVLSVLAFNPTLLAFENNILSDIPFLFCSTLSLLLIDRMIVAPGKPEGSPLGNVWLGIALFVAFSLRPNGILLVPALFLTQAILYVRQDRSGADWKRILPVALIPYLAFAVFALALLVALPRGEASYLTNFKALSVEGLSENLSTYFAQPVEFFDSVPFGNFLYGALLPFLVAGTVLNVKDDFPSLVYVGETLLLYITWPIQGGLRYLFPLLPFLIYFSYRGMQGSAFMLTARYRRAGTFLTRASWAVVLALFARASFGLGRANLVNERAASDGPFAPNSTEMFDVIRTQTAPGSVVVFDKPRAMRLMTGRDGLLIDSCDQLSRGNYVVLRKKTGAVDQVAPDDIGTCNHSLMVMPIFDNQQFVVYRLLPKP